MKTLLLLRHAKSSWSEAGLSDHDRPLNKRGKRTAPLMGKFLAEQNLVPDRIVSSTAVRARDTAALIAEHSSYDREVIETEVLYLPTIAKFVAAIHEYGGDTGSLMLVAHNPGIEDFLQSLVGEYERMPTCALAVVRIAIDDWLEFTKLTRGELAGMWRPRELFDDLD